MEVRSLQRLFLIVGIIVLVAVLGSFIGVYVLFWAMSTYGFWLYVFGGVAFFGLVAVLYIYELRKERRKEASPEPEISD